MRLHGRSVSCTDFLRATANTDNASDAFIRDELSKGRFDPAVADICFAMTMELFGRTLRSDLGAMARDDLVTEHVC